MRVVCAGVVMLLAGAATALAQDYYGYVDPPYGDYHHASTAAEGAMSGMSRVVRSAGQYNLMTSQAAINMTEVQRNTIQNRAEWADTYFQMRAANREYRAQERGPRVSTERLARLAQAGKPQRLSPSELDSVTGAITWPIILQAQPFAAYRTQLESLFAARASRGTLSAEEYVQADKTTKAFLASLKERIRDFPAPDYIEAKKFLESLAYEARIPTT